MAEVVHPYYVAQQYRIIQHVIVFICDLEAFVIPRKRLVVVKGRVKRMYPHAVVYGYQRKRFLVAFGRRKHPVKIEHHRIGLVRQDIRLPEIHAGNDHKRSVPLFQGDPIALAGRLDQIMEPAFPRVYPPQLGKRVGICRILFKHFQQDRL